MGELRRWHCCIDVFALMYSTLALGVDIVDFETVHLYNEALKKKLSDEGKKYEPVRTTCYEDPPIEYDYVSDKNNKGYYVLRTSYLSHDYFGVNPHQKDNLKKMWKSHIIYQDKDLINASMDQELLSILGITDSTRIIEFLKELNLELPDDKKIDLGKPNKKGKHSRNLKPYRPYH